MSMIIFIFFFIIKSSFLHAMEGESGQHSPQRHDIVPRLQNYEKVPLRNFAGAISTQLYCWKDEKHNLEITAITVNDKSHLEGWERYAVISNRGEKAYVHHRSSHPALLENEKHLKSLTKVLSVFSPPQDPFSSLMRIEDSLIEYATADSCYPQGALEDIIKDIQEADIVVFLIGAGISACLVPDLLNYYQQLELTIIPSSDKATRSSYLAFSNRMIEDREYRASIIKAHQQFDLLLSKSDNGLEPTAAHHALSRVVSFLKSQDKNVKVFSSNVDGLEEKAGIMLDEEEDCETSTVGSMIPKASEIEQKKSVIISIGKSSDHGADLSRIYKKSRTAKSSTHFYTFNKNDKPIIGYELDDSDNVTNTFVLPMRVIQGDIQVTLPQLREELIQ